MQTPVRSASSTAAPSSRSTTPRRRARVLDWLREDARCTGTKEGCAEGDCGACTVVIGELADGAPATRRDARRRPRAAHRQRLHPVPARARRQGAVHRRGPEGDARRRAAPGAARAGRVPRLAMRLLHAGLRRCRCGTCTSTISADGTRPTRQQLADDLSGNLCRCTGYRPILDAGAAHVRAAGASPSTTAPALAALRTLRGRSAVASTRIDALAASTRRARSTSSRAAARRSAAGDACSPARPTSACGSPSSSAICGDLIYVGEVAELKRIERARRQRLAHRRRRLAGRRLARAGRAHGRRCEDVWLRFASLPIRNAGTMGGNVANGSPIGDSAPVLIALDARARAAHAATRVRTLPLAEFYVDYMKNRLEPGEFVQALDRAAARRGERSRSAPTSSRSASTATSPPSAPPRDRRSTATAVVRAARFAFGGMAAIVQRARAQAEAAVLGQPWTEATVAGRDARARRRLHAADRHARQRRLPHCRWRRTCCAASGSRRARRRRSARRDVNVCARMPSSTQSEARDEQAQLEPFLARSPRAATARGRAQSRAARASASAGRTSRRICTSPARRRTPTTSPSSPAPCTPRSACRRSRTAIAASIDLDRIRALPGVVDVFSADGHPRRQRLRPDHRTTIRSSPTAHRALRRPAGVRRRRRRRATPRAAPRRRPKDVLEIEPLPADPHARRTRTRAGQYVRAADAPARAATRARARSTPRRTGCRARSTSAARSSSISRARSPTRCRRRTTACRCTARRSTRARCSTSSRMRCGCSSHHVQVECRRMGGGFGGKESQSALFACVRRGRGAAACSRPVKLRLDRDDDFLVTGKRHCFRYEYEVGYDDAGRDRSASRSTMVSRAGYSADLSGPVMTRAVCHFDNAYWLPDVAIHGYSRQDQHAVATPRSAASAGRRARSRSRYILDSIARTLGTRSARRAPRQLLRHRRSATSRRTASRSTTTSSTSWSPSSKPSSDYRARRAAIARLQRARARC